MKVKLSWLLVCAVAVLGFASPAFAQEVAKSDGLSAIGKAIPISLAALGASLGQGRAVAAAMEGIGRNPAAAGKLFVPMILGLVFMESLTILAFVISVGM